MKKIHASFRHNLKKFLIAYLCCFTLFLFLKFLSLVPVLSDVYDEALLPFQERRIDLDVAWKKAEVPIRTFLASQIERTGNQDTVISLLGYIPGYKTPEVITWRNVPWAVLLPGFLVNEFKAVLFFGSIVAIIFLPFLAIDVIILTVMPQTGTVLPSVIFSLPLKLITFVLINGWELATMALLDCTEVYVPVVCIG